MLKDRQAMIRVHEPAVAFHDHELLYGFTDEKEAMGLSAGNHGVVRMGRGLVQSKRMMGSSQEEREREELALRSRGRKIERVR